MLPKRNDLAALAPLMAKMCANDTSNFLPTFELPDYFPRAITESPASRYSFVVAWKCIVCKHFWEILFKSGALADIPAVGRHGIHRVLHHPAVVSDRYLLVARLK